MVRVGDLQLLVSTSNSITSYAKIDPWWNTMQIVFPPRCLTRFAISGRAVIKVLNKFCRCVTAVSSYLICDESVLDSCCCGESCILDWVRCSRGLSGRRWRWSYWIASLSACINHVPTCRATQLAATSWRWPITPSMPTSLSRCSSRCWRWASSVRERTSLTDGIDLTFSSSLQGLYSTLALFAACRLIFLN